MLRAFIAIAFVVIPAAAAILHDHELTYSLVLPLPHRWARAPFELYTAIHTGLVETLKTFGPTCQLSQSHSDTPFLCFQRRSPGDILLHDAKVVGSAQATFQGRASAAWQHALAKIKSRTAIAGAGGPLREIPTERRIGKSLRGCRRGRFGISLRAKSSHKGRTYRGNNFGKK